MTTQKKRRFSWRKQASETGLRSIGQGPRGAELFYNGVRIAWVSADGGGATNGPFRGWYWVVTEDSKLGLPWRNTVRETPLPQDIKDAKAACKAFVESHLKEE